MSDQLKKTLKEIARWLVLLIVSGIITQILAQITNVPEFLNFKVWVFTFSIPFRFGLTTFLTFVGRIVDKLIHDNEPTGVAGGLLKF